MALQDEQAELPPPRRVWVAPVATLLGVLGLFGLLLAGQLSYLHRDRLAEARRESEGQALVVAQHAARTVEGIDMKLRTVAAVFAGMEAPLDPRDRRLHDLLRQLVQPAPAIRSIMIFDRAGRLVHDAGAYPARSMEAGERDYFTVPRDNPEIGLHIGEGILSRLSGRWTIPLARRLTDREGGFAGVVIAGLEPVYFDRFYGEVRGGGAGHLDLRHADGRLVARHPYDDTLYGQPDAEMDLVWSTLTAEARGLVQVDAGAGKGPSYVAFRRVEQYPLVATVVTRFDDALAEWRRLALNLGLGYLLFALAAAGVTALVIRQRRGRSELAGFRDQATMQLRRQFEQSNDAQFLARNGTLLDCNEAAVRLFRASGRAELLARPAASIWAERLADGTPTAAVKEEKKALARRVGFHRFPWRGRRLDGEEFPAEVTLTPVTSEPEGTLLAVWRDLTAEEAQAKALNDNLRLLDTTFQNLSQGLCVFEGDHRLLAWNNRFAELLGIPANLLRVGITFEEMVREMARRGEYGPGDVEAIVAERTAQAFSGVAVDFRRDRPDGRIIQGSGRPMQGGGFVTIYSDVTELELARREAETAEARLRSAVEALDAAFVVLDAEDRLVLCNSRYLGFLGITPEQARPGMTFREILQAAERGNLGGLHDPATRAERIEARTLRLRSGEGPFEVPLHDGRIMLASDQVMPDGSVVGLRTDITEQKRQSEQLARHVEELERSRALLASQTRDLSKLAEEYATARRQAEAANAAKTQFLAMVSHEMRTPLSGVMGMLELLAASRLEEEQSGWIRLARQSADQLLAVIDDVLDVAKLEAGRVELETLDFAIDPLVDGVCAMLSARAQAAGIALTVTRDPALPAWLRGDPTRLRQVLLNLVGNAVKFTKGGRVTIGLGLARAAGRPRVRIEVADTGIGIPDHALSRIFDRFTQADLSTTRRFGGTGLGLSICKQLVTLMGGEIGVSSALGRGSTFWFDFPLQAGAPPKPAGGGGEREPAPALPRLHVLLAEDNAINQMLVRSMLENAGHRVSVADNGALAVAAAEREDFDIVLMDGHMPVMDGVAATQAIRALHGPRGRVPVIAVTADALSVDRDRYLAAGMYEVVTKPIDFPRLYAVMARALAGEPAPEPAPPPPAHSLLDQAHLGVLRASVGAEGLRELLVALPEGIESALAAIRSAPDRAALAREAHGLRGLAANLGAAAVAAAAGRVERAAREGDVPEALVEDLRRTAAQTRLALERGLEAG